MADHLAPVAPKKPIERTFHGDTFVDDYEWLRDKENPEVIRHLENENAYTDANLEHLAGLREDIFGEIKSRTQETDLSTPVRRGSWWYYSRTVEGKQYGMHCRAPIRNDDDWTPPRLEPGVAVEGEQVLLDSNQEAEGHDFFSLGSFTLNAEGTLLAFGVDTKGDERYRLRFKDLTTGALLPDEIPNTFPGVAFDAAGDYLFYSTVDDAWRPDTIWRHRIGTSADDDVKVFKEPDDRYWIGIGRSRSREYLILTAGSKITSEVHVLEAANPNGDFRVVWPRVDGIEYSVEHAKVAGEDRFVILHNADQADFSLIDVPVADPSGPRRPVLRDSTGMRLEGADAFDGHLAISYRQDGLTRLGVVPLGDEGYGELNPISFDEALGSVGIGGNPEWRQRTLRLGYTSMVTPMTICDYDVSSGELRELKRQPVLGDFDPERYEQRREWVSAADGARIPLSIVYRKDLVSPGTPAPLLLYGYGSYEVSIDPYFSVARLSLLDRGMVFVIAHVRGGGEMGRAWYDNGKTLSKRNTFTDYIACADQLIANGWTTADRMVASGGSAGGLLMGAVANMAPDRFAGILAVVPFVDALTSILDPDLPLTVIEWDEWGDPLHDSQVYAYMKSYTPYENVTEQKYPRILAVTSLNDTRVLYVEPAKWVARLREVDAPVLLKTEMSAGHGGVSGRYESWKETSYEFAWALDTVGLAGAGSQ
ncbi:S9 family peptidase [Saxibacter everestensis]|uniref:S9 family peptidase n=1 Tax=Saxibacter everestensis TaxID=2909229 RepID=A0ABY8QVH7_9MICO|nr:S9 family peptidase [Brevibacteriaceae bacterium ZFBP1038]